jgi:hypothetical protein
MLGSHQGRRLGCHKLPRRPPRRRSHHPKIRREGCDFGIVRCQQTKLTRSEPIHVPGILEEILPPQKHLGPVDPATVEHADDEEEKPRDTQGIPPIHQVINIDDFEVFPLSSVNVENRGAQWSRSGLGILLLRRRRYTL